MTNITSEHVGKATITSLVMSLANVATNEEGKVRRVQVGDVEVVPIGEVGVTATIKSEAARNASAFRGTFVECWNQTHAGFTWVVPFAAKMKLRDLRVHNQDWAHFPVTVVAGLNKTTQNGVTKDQDFIHAVDQGTGLRWGISTQPTTLELPASKLLLIVPNNYKECADMPVTDVLVGTSGGMVVSWAHGMQPAVVASRETYNDTLMY